MNNEEQRIEFETQILEQSDTGLIFERIPALMLECGSIGKERQSPDLPYKFRGADDVDAHIQPLLGKHEIFIVPIVRSVEATERVNPNNPAKITSCVLITADFRWFCKDGSFFTSRTVGFAYDHSDKAANKAMTAARKYNICQTLSIPTSDPKDVENENIETGPRVGRAPQARTGGGYATREEAMAAAEAKRAAAQEPLTLPSGIVIGPAPGADADPKPTPASSEKKATNARVAAKPAQQKAGNGQPAEPAKAGSQAPSQSVGSTADSAEIRTDRPDMQALLQVFQVGTTNGWDKAKLNSYAMNYLGEHGVNIESKQTILSEWTWKHFDDMVQRVSKAPHA